MDRKNPETRAPDAETLEESAQNSAPVESISAAERLAELEEQRKRLEEEKKSLFDQLVRRQADFENFRKRLERQHQDARKYAEADLVAGLLPVLDALERALAAPVPGGGEEYRKGIELIYKQLWDALARAGLKPVGAVGKPFDPFFHHAVERVQSTTHSDQEVLAELQRGYTFKERLLRPALVRVAVAPAPREPNPETPEPED